MIAVSPANINDLSYAAAAAAAAAWMPIAADANASCHPSLAYITRSILHAIIIMRLRDVLPKTVYDQQGSTMCPQNVHLFIF